MPRPSIIFALLCGAAALLITAALALWNLLGWWTLALAAAALAPSALRRMSRGPQEKST